MRVLKMCPFFLDDLITLLIVLGFGVFCSFSNFFGVQVRVRVTVKARVTIKVRVGFRVRVRFKVSDRVRVRVRVKVRDI